MERVKAGIILLLADCIKQNVLVILKEKGEGR